MRFQILLIFIFLLPQILFAQFEDCNLDPECVEKVLINKKWKLEGIRVNKYSDKPCPTISSLYYSFNPDYSLEIEFEKVRSCDNVKIQSMVLHKSEYKIIEMKTSRLTRIGVRIYNTHPNLDFPEWIIDKSKLSDSLDYQFLFNGTDLILRENAEFIYDESSKNIFN